MIFFHRLDGEKIFTGNKMREKITATFYTVKKT